MSRLADAEILVSVVEAGGFTAAARALGLSQPAVSRRIAALEERLGMRLFARSTRSLRLTDAGAAFYERCRRALAELEEAESEAAAEQGDLRGMLRLTAAPAYARRVLVPHLAAFSAANPSIELDLLLTERRVDLLDEGFHLALRVRDPGPQASLMRKRVDTFTTIVCASDAYLSSHPAPRAPDDLVRHACLSQRGDAGQDTWRFERDGKSYAVEVKGPLRSNDADALRLGACAGLGIALLPSYLVDDDLASGKLRRVLPRYQGERVEMFAVYPERKHLPARLRALLDFLSERLGRSPQRTTATARRREQ